MPSPSDLGWSRWNGPPPARSVSPTAFGAVPASQPEPALQDSALYRDLKTGLHRVTPTLILLGIVTGAAFAVGSGLIDRYVFTKKP